MRIKSLTYRNQSTLLPEAFATVIVDNNTRKLLPFNIVIIIIDKYKICQ